MGRTEAVPDTTMIELACTKLVNQFAVFSDLGRYDELAALFTEDGRYARPTDPTSFVEGRSNLLASLNWNSIPS